MGEVQEKTGEWWHAYHPCDRCLRNDVQETMAYYQPVPTRTCWTPPAMGWAEDGVGLAEVESPELCQRLDVAGGDMTEAPECASWVPAVLAVRTGLRKRDGPWVCF